MDEELFRKAGRERKVVRIRYTDLKGNASIRNVEPYEIRDGKLWAYCRKKRGIRQFALDRVSDARPTRYTFLPKYPVTFDAGHKKTAMARTVLCERWFGPYEGAPLL